MSHDPTVTAAVITVVGAGGVAIAAFFTTAWSTRRTLDSAERSTKATIEATAQAAKDAAHAERSHAIWEKRTEVYKKLLDYIDATQSLDYAVEFDASLRFRQVQEGWTKLGHDVFMYGSDNVNKLAAEFFAYHLALVFQAVNQGGDDRTKAAQEYHKGQTTTGLQHALKVKAAVRNEMQSVDRES